MSDMDKDILNKNVSKKKKIVKNKNVNQEQPVEKIKKDTSNKNSNNKKTTNTQKKKTDNSNNNTSKTNTNNKKKRSNKRSNRSKNSSVKNKNNESVKKVANNNSDLKTKKNTVKNTEKNQTETSKNIETKKKIKDNNINKTNTYSKLESNKKNRKIITTIVLFITIALLILLATSIIFKENYKKRQKEHLANLEKEIKEHYNVYVKTNNEADIYKLKKQNYSKVGKISANQELTLEDKEVTYEDEYLKITDFEGEYYIYYKDINAIEELTEIDTRYQKYILFNKNIITKDKVSFYDEEGNLVYQFNKSFELPIIINKEKLYGVEINDRLLYVKKEDVKEIDDNINTRLTNTKGIAVLNYHFFYDETKASERADCNQIICHSKSSFTSHLEYIKNNDIFTPTMDEFEMYLNKEINLPKSVLITIDDGWRTTIGTQLLEKYQLNGTIFLITSWFKEINFLNNLDYVEYHSHGDNLHNQGVCSGGQGGAIKCLEKTKLLSDLKLSREKLDGSTAFCYPFYEYNNYSIEVLKEAGFTLAFAGGFKKATPSTDKYQIPRYVIYNTTTVGQIKNYIG